METNTTKWTAHKQRRVNELIILKLERSLSDAEFRELDRLLVLKKLKEKYKTKLHDEPGLHTEF